MKEEFNKKNPVAWIYQLVRVGKIFTIRCFKVFVHKMKIHDADCSSRFYYDCKLNLVAPADSITSSQTLFRQGSPINHWLVSKGALYTL